MLKVNTPIFQVRSGSEPSASPLLLSSPKKKAIHMMFQVKSKKRISGLKGLLGSGQDRLCSVPVVTASECSSLYSGLLNYWYLHHHSVCWCVVQKTASCQGTDAVGSAAGHRNCSSRPWAMGPPEQPRPWSDSM